jgi:hypothetical protein
MMMELLNNAGSVDIELLIEDYGLGSEVGLCMIVGFGSSLANFELGLLEVLLLLALLLCASTHIGKYDKEDEGEQRWQSL